MKRKLKYFIIACLILLALGSLPILSHNAPTYLIYREEPKKADCIIPLLGTEYIERKKEAFQLISEGFSNVLLIPPRYRLVKVTDAKEKIPVQVKEELSELSILAYKVHPKYRWHENTHLELILAKEYMEAYGFDSAIIVSSPYHMRRVKLLAEYVFPEDNFVITCVPDRYEVIRKAWWKDRKSLSWIAMEYSKIAWFLFYQRFSQMLTYFVDTVSQILHAG